jgi:hypothetical protein
MSVRELNPIPPALCSTPWGSAHGAYEYAEGLVFCHTASHGGLYCSLARWCELLERFPRFVPFNRNSQWLEEDEDFALAPIVWPQFFDPPAVFNAVRTAIHAAAAYREPNPWPAVTAWLQSSEGAAVRKIAEEYEKTIAGQWERGGMSAGFFFMPQKFKITPGPWRVGDAGNTVFGPKMEDGSSPVIVASCDYQQTRAGGSKKANATLIAAAPDLLEACKLLCDNWGAVEISGLVAQARAAIAMAEGRAS